MISLDTNVVVRIVAQDDPVQFERAAQLLESSICFIPDTVLLESAWVLLGYPGATRATLHDGLMKLLGHENVRVQDPGRTANAMKWYSAGMSFADAMHLACSEDAERFCSFDRRLVRRAVGIDSVPVAEPPPARKP